MLDSPIELVARDPHWRTVLEAYRDAQRAKRETQPEGDAWVARLRSAPPAPEERLSQIHGRLIAHGLVKFQLSGQGAATSLEYQITPLGRRALGEAIPTEEESAAENRAA